jgi:hypothetical protein
VAHRDAVVDGDGVELLGDTAGRLDLARDELPKSESFMPVARQRPRAPAMLRPWVVVRERYCGMMLSSGDGTGGTTAGTQALT